MNIGKYVPTVATLIVAAVVMAGVAFPMIGNLSAETTTISNDGASWIRMAYITDQSDYSVEYTFGDNISVAGQSGEWEDMILYADSQCTICIVGDYLVKIVGDVAYASDDPQTVTVSRSSGIVSIDGEPVSESTVSWAYVPVANGKYSSFGADTVPLHRNSALATVGGFAGVYAYNENVSMDLGFVMDADVTEEYINSVRWALESDIPVEETQPFHPIDPGMLDPGILNPGTDDPAVIDDPSTLDPQYIDPDIGGNMIMSVPTPTYTDGDWGFDLDAQNRAIIVSYSGSGGSITVPTTVTYGGNTYNVYQFGKGGTNPTVFDDSNISDFTLTFPSNFYYSDVYIGNYACAGCTHLTAITFERNMNGSQYAFSDCTSLTTISYTPSSDGLGIKQYEFAGCTALTSVPFDKIYYINQGGFKDCTSLSGSITLNGRNGLYSYIFNGCTGIQSVTIPQNAILYAGHQFEGCTGLTTVVMNCSMTYSQGGIFKGCTSLSSITFGGTVTEIPEFCFEDCTSLTSITIPNSVTKIMSGSFKNSGIESITIPNSVTEIKSQAFSGCTNLTSVVLPENITALPVEVFMNCTSLEEAVLPNNITSIGVNAFAGCTSMGPTLVLPAHITTIAMGSFSGCSSLVNLIVLSNAVPETPNANYKEAFAETSITQVLNLGSAEYTTTSYGLDAEEVRSDIAATSYLAVVSISETTTKEGPTFDLLAILPIVFVAGLLLTTAWLFIRK